MIAPKHFNRSTGYDASTREAEQTRSDRIRPATTTDCPLGLRARTRTCRYGAPGGSHLPTFCARVRCALPKHRSACMKERGLSRLVVCSFGAGAGVGARQERRGGCRRLGSARLSARVLRVFPSVRSSRRGEECWQARLPRHVSALTTAHDGIGGRGHVGLNQFDDSQHGAGVMPILELATRPCPSLTLPPELARGSGSRRRVGRSRRA
jgi:hypothetical protein